MVTHPVRKGGVATVIKECPVHGYFRGEMCPECGRNGRFIMDDREVERVGRMMAGALRHFPEKYGLAMGDTGFVSIRALATAIRVRRRDLKWIKAKHIIALACTDPKGRYEVRGEMIRATYGHTVDVDLDLPTDNIPPKLYYPATGDELDFLLKHGIQPTDRRMVHLSATPEAAHEAGRHRCSDPAILEIDTAGVIESGSVIMKAGKTVYITLSINPEYVAQYRGEIHRGETGDGGTEEQTEEIKDV